MILLFVAVVSTLACFCFTALELIGHERLRIIHNYYSYQRLLCVPVWVGFVLRFKFLIDSCLSLKEKIIIEMSLQANEISGNRFTQAINFVPFFDMYKFPHYASIFTVKFYILTQSGNLLL